VIRNSQVIIDRLGVSGYLGGHIAVRIAEDHPEWTINAMVRSTEQADAINKVLPNVNCAVGDLDDAEFLIEQASMADIVISELATNAFMLFNLPLIKGKARMGTC
jgi:nucleoside-diphosphate-sugar epimerase